MYKVSTYSKIKPTSDRILQTIPGLITWFMITSPIWGVLLFPIAYATFLLCYIIIWFLKSIRTLLFFSYSFYKIHHNVHVKWDTLYLKDNSRDKVKHIVIIPFVKEGYTVLEPLLRSLARQTFNTKQIYICLTYEQRFPQGKELAEKLYLEFKEVFGGIWINEHTLEVGEVVGKGANCASASKLVKKKVEELSFDKDYLSLMACDCDSVFPRHFFSYFTYEFLKEKNRHFIFWAGSMAYMQNYWDLPHFARVFNSANSYFNLATIARSYSKFIQISTFISSYKLFESTDYYEKGVISDDFHSFFVSLFTYPGKVRCQTLFCMVDSDACEGSGIADNAKRLFVQVQRWSWGVEDFVFLVKNTFLTFKRKDVTLINKLYTGSRALGVIIDHQLWPISGFLFIFTNIIILYFLKNNEFSIFWSSTSQLLSTIFAITTITGLLAIIVEFIIRPKHPYWSSKKFGIKKFLFFFFDSLIEFIHWLLYPVMGIFFGSIPAILSHTILMLGKHIGFVLTEKK
jgi:hypothetical protein